MILSLIAYIASICIIQTVCKECAFCGENEILVKCKNPCEATCQNPLPPNCNFFACVQGCICKPGYLRDESTGLCVSSSECCTACPPNEENNYNKEQCEPTCQDYPNGKLCSSQIKPCICQPGFLRDKNTGQCVRLEECPKPVCGINEIWKECSDTLCRRTCKNKDSPPPCPRICKAGCSCIEGFIWDDDANICIPEDMCPKQCPLNEIQNCKKQRCESICQNQTIGIYCYPYIKDCVCQPGFLRDFNTGNCISADQCPRACGENEEWSICASPSCRKTCQNRFGTNQFCPYVCIPGCECKSGYIWDKESNQCVPETQCPPYVCGVNEEFKNCSDRNCRRSCQNEGEELFCPLICEPGCSCINGFIWDDDTQHCIPKDLCPKKCPLNERLNCKRILCELSCQNSDSSLQCSTLPKECICQLGFLRDPISGTCVLPGDCPKVCGINEEWSNCSYNECRTTCQNLGKVVHCPRLSCQPGCVCKQGFVWDEESKSCILQDQCPHVCGINEEWRQCSNVDCRETCQSEKPKMCTAICKSGCACKDGFIWDEYIKQCVERYRCSQVCGINQEWCASIPDNIPTCQSLNRRPYHEYPFNDYFALPGFQNINKFAPGCKCKNGFVWDEASRACVLPENCPSLVAY